MVVHPSDASLRDMSIRRAAFAATTLTAILLAVALLRPDPVSAGTISGDLPENGGVALVSWSGGPTSDILQSAGSQGCTPNSVWSFVGGAPVGYLVGAPDFVNVRYLAIYPDGVIPEGPLLLVCRPTIVLEPGDAVGSVVAAQPAGTSFVFRPGLYRLATITASKGDTFRGDPGAILSGARVLEDFEPQGELWTIGRMTSQIRAHGSCAAFLGQRYTGCQHAEQLFIDGQVLWQVTDPAQLTTGRWYFDYDANRIYVADDPGGRLVELSVTGIGLRGPARNVTVSGLVFEKYANRAQAGVIDAGDASVGWLIEDVEVRYSHGTGLRTHTEMVVRDSFFHHNGQNGIGGKGDRVLIEGNEISYNGISGFDPFWESGGTKWVVTDGLVVRDNHVHHNSGRGLWTDIYNVNTLIEGNLVEDNGQSGIVHEISYRATIRNNIVRNNGLDFDVWLWGAQILVQNSPDTTVIGNTVTVAANGGDGIGVINQNRGSGPLGAHVSENATVTGNDVTYLGSAGQSGVADDTAGRPACQSAAGNTFDGNTYHVTDPQEDRWFWCGDADWDDFRDLGAEASGAAITE